MPPEVSPAKASKELAIFVGIITAVVILIVALLVNVAADLSRQWAKYEAARTYAEEHGAGTGVIPEDTDGTDDTGEVQFSH